MAFRGTSGWLLLARGDSSCKHTPNWTSALLQVPIFCAISSNSSRCPASTAMPFTPSLLCHYYPFKVAGVFAPASFCRAWRWLGTSMDSGLGAISVSIPSIRKLQLSPSNLVGGCFSSSHLPKSTGKPEGILTKREGHVISPCAASAQLRLIR